MNCELSFCFGYRTIRCSSPRSWLEVLLSLLSCSAFKLSSTACILFYVSLTLFFYFSVCFLSTIKSSRCIVVGVGVGVNCEISSLTCMNMNMNGYRDGWYRV